MKMLKTGVFVVILGLTSLAALNLQAAGQKQENVSAETCCAAAQREGVNEKVCRFLQKYVSLDIVPPCQRLLMCLDGK